MTESKKIGVLSAIIVQMNAMIGAGIVAIPAFLAEEVGLAGILSYVLSTITILCLAISLAKLAKNYQGKGWTYLYPSLYGGHILGMVSSFCYILGVLIAMGFVAKQCGIWIHEILPILDPYIFSIIMVMLLTFIVIAGTKTSSIGQFIISAAVVMSIIIISTVCFLNFNPKLLTPFMPHGIKPVFSIAPKILFGYLGFECIISLYAITHNPQKNIMKAAISGVILVSLLYMIFAVSILSAITVDTFLLHKGSSLAAIFITAFPKHKYLNSLIYIGGIFAIIGTLHSMIWTLSLQITDITKKIQNASLLKFSQISTGSIKRSALLCALIICLTVLLLHDEIILAIAVSLMIISYLLTISSLFFKKEEIKSYRIIYPILAVIGGFIMIGFSINSIFVYFR
ncbi:MAG: Aspartate-proton symporter [Candidatus Anoxychlamydiales bacterium]|nr:Aspartate-proton symporter [Candidatus Anoxychlamydiales bacterium]NGX35696.1 Aspartate-proton symporter [Candidatus Anoxychlamydiales bacterium]